MVEVMGKLEVIEKSVAELSPEELRAFTEWFDEFREQQVDIWLEREVAAGSFDELARQAREEFKAGRTRPL
ncbi:MAG: hypothetical protein ACRC7G_17625 [Beijerinckiaceae bacterium]